MPVGTGGVWEAGNYKQMRSPGSENLLSGEIGSVDLKESFLLSLESPQNSQWALLIAGVFISRHSNHKALFRITSSLKEEGFEVT